MDTLKPRNCSGESILEILLAVAIFSIVLPAILYTMGALASSQPGRNMYFDALVLTEETKNTIQQLKSTRWDTVSHDGEYVLVTAEGTDSLMPLTTTPIPDQKGFVRTIEISDVRRTNGLIVTQGGLVDSATKKISVHISWGMSQTPVTTEFYVMRTDGFNSYVLTNMNDFSQGGAIFGGTKVVSSGSGQDAEITLNNGDVNSETGLISWWKMSGEYADSQAEIDTAPNGVNNLRIFGSPSFGMGRFNKKVVLDSNNKYMVAPSSASLELREQMSIIAWVKATSMPNDATIIHKMTDTGLGYHLGVDSLGKISAQVGNGMTTLTAQQTTQPILGGLWHQVASTYDGSQLLVYVDGLQGTVMGHGAGSLGVNTEPLSIGRNPSFTNHNFTGEIDDVQIYNVALTPTTIQKLLYSTYTSSPKDLGKDMFIHSLGATIFQPPDTKVGFQIAIREYGSGGCDNSPYYFVGKDGTESTFFDSEDINQALVSSVLPGTSGDGQFSNPGRCMRWKAYLFSAKDQGVGDPSVKDIHFTYSP